MEAKHKYKSKKPEIEVNFKEDTDQGLSQPLLTNEGVEGEN
jgi:hypothetical protein